MSERARRLIQYLRQISDGDGLVKLAERAASRTQRGLEEALESSTVPPPPTPERRQAEMAVEAASLLRDEKFLNEEHLDALEAIVLLEGRPVIDVVKNSYEKDQFGWPELDQHRIKVEAAIRSICRVELIGHPSAPYAGTAFIVGPRHLLTNRHVAGLFMSGVGAEARLSAIPGRSAELDFLREIDRPERASIEVEDVVLVHPHWDAAILVVSSDAGEPWTGREPLKLATSPPSDLATTLVAAIGYPFVDARNDLAQQERIFRGAYGVKRLQPGKLRSIEPILSFQHQVEALTHDCSTLGGNSGSAVVDLATGYVVGLHFGGRYLVANFAVPTWELARDARLRDLGLNFMQPLDTALPAWLDAWRVLETETMAEAATASTTPAPEGVLSGDWYERVGDDDIARALDRDREGTIRMLSDVLGSKEAVELADDLDDLDPDADIEAIPEPDPSLPEILLLPGIMGSHLAQTLPRVDRIWLDPIDIMFSDLRNRLSLAPDGITDVSLRRVEPRGLLELSYKKPTIKWRKARFVVHQVDFDWRKPLATAADRLHGALEALARDRPNKRFVIVAHSMGGLVASIYARRHPEWEQRIERAVFMGSPLRGSYAPIECVVGTYPIVKKMVAVSPANTMLEMRMMASTLPGLLEMMPDPSIFGDVEAAYEHRNWPGPSAATPLPAMLMRSRAIKSDLATSPLLGRATQLATVDRPTVTRLASGNPVTPGPRNGAGDGTVPARAAVFAGLPAFKVRSSHSNIPSDPLAIQAVIDLVLTGKCSLAPVTDADLDPALSIEEAPSESVTALELEAAASGVSQRLSEGRLTREDVRWLLAPDFEPPGN